MKIRYSMIDTFVQCPMKFYRSYILNEREIVKSADLEFGTAVHLALNSLFQDEDPYEIFSMYWDSVKNQQIEYKRNGWEELNSLAIEKFLPNFIRLHKKKFANVKLEETLESEFLGHTLQGTFDLCGEYEGTLTMVDFKTSAREYPLSKIIRNPQLYIYSYLYHQKYGELPKQLMYKVFIKGEGRIQTVKLPLTQSKLDLQMQNLQAIVKNMLHMIENKAYYSNYGCFCSQERLCFPEAK